MEKAPPEFAATFTRLMEEEPFSPEGFLDAFLRLHPGSADDSTLLVCQRQG